MKIFLANSTQIVYIYGINIPLRILSSNSIKCCALYHYFIQVIPIIITMVVQNVPLQTFPNRVRSLYSVMCSPHPVKWSLYLSVPYINCAFPPITTFHNVFRDLMYIQEWQKHLDIARPLFGKRLNIASELK